MDPRLGSAVATSNAAPSPASQESAKETAQQVIPRLQILTHHSIDIHASVQSNPLSLTLP